MDERKEKIAAAGYAVVGRYGIKRVTVNDVAEEAGVSRQTIYNIFPNREAMLASVVTYHFNKQWRELWHACEGVSDRKQRFEIAFRKLLIEPWEAMQKMPHADDLELEIASISRAATEAINRELEANMVSLFEPYEDALHLHSLTTRSLAQMVWLSVSSLKLSSTTRQQVESVAAAMMACVLAVTGGPAPGCTGVTPRSKVSSLARSQI
jgi:AcrR family transcriptional regulator